LNNLSASLSAFTGLSRTHPSQSLFLQIALGLRVLADPPQFIKSTNQRLFVWILAPHDEPDNYLSTRIHAEYLISICTFLHFPAPYVLIIIVSGNRVMEGDANCKNSKIKRQQRQQR
jgi:hypothetical protein